MSFSSDTKKELSQIQNKNICCNLAECYGMLLFAKRFTYNQFVLTTENQYVASHFCQLIAETLYVSAEKRTSLSAKKGGTHLYTVTIPNADDCFKIFSHFGHRKEDVSLHINRANFEDDSCISAFIRGAFMCCGTVTDPKSDYHLEFSVPYKNLSTDLAKLISEIEELSCSFKAVNRKGNFVLYIKGSDFISDVLAYMGASISSMALMQEIMLKELRNKINRKTNSEVANIKKTADASSKQIEAITKIQKSKGLESLPDDLKELAYIRLDNPDLSLRDIGKLLVPQISRSGVNHRMVRILDIANKVKG